MEAKNNDMNSQPTTKIRKIKGMVEIEVQKCKGCELCTATCKEGALSMSHDINAKGYHYVLADNDLCTGCVNCALVCPDAVITVYRTLPNKQKENITPSTKEGLQQVLNDAGFSANNNA